MDTPYTPAKRPPGRPRNSPVRSSDYLWDFARRNHCRFYADQWWFRVQDDEAQEVDWEPLPQDPKSTALVIVDLVRDAKMTLDEAVRTVYQLVNRPETAQPGREPMPSPASVAALEG